MEQKPIYLDRNENNYGPAPACYEVLRNADLTRLSWYTRAHVSGIRSILSERIAKDFGMPESRVILGYGAEDILKQAIQCYLGKDQKLMVPTYSWWYYKKIAAEVDGLNVEYPMIPGEDSFHYDVKGMLDLYVREKPSVVFISSPNNPTGNSISIEDLNLVLHEFGDALVVLDEAYSYAGKSEYVRGLVDENANLLVVRTFSKYYALAGIRIGFALMGENLSRLSRFTNRYLGYHRLSEEVALAALDSPEYYQMIAQNMRDDKELYYRELGRLPGFTVYRSDANFVLVAIPRDIKGSLNAFLTQRGLVVKFLSEELLNSHIRISLGTREQNRMVIDAIQEFCRERD
jgi:histidinol-phosphate aminotransferase